MINVTVACSNPDDIRLKVTAEFTIAQWREILRREESERPRYYAPYDEFLNAVQRAIRSIEKREEIACELRPDLDKTQ